jgi:hypothetical protein
MTPKKLNDESVRMMRRRKRKKKISTRKGGHGEVAVESQMRQIANSGGHGTRTAAARQQ